MATVEACSVDDVQAVVPASPKNDVEAAIPASPKDGADNQGPEGADATGAKGADVTAKPLWPLWKLCLLALPQLGVQVMWGFLGPNSAPYMKHLGAPNSLATLNNIAGPIVGFFTGPIVGAWSDRNTSRWGRRRPIIIGGLISTWIAGALFSASEHLLPEGSAIWFAAPMYWILDITINVLQTPNRALVSDLASEEQQVPMQVVFVFMMAIGNFIAYTMLKIYEVPTDHMLELMLIICAINTVCVVIQSMIAKETPLARSADATKESCCAPVTSVFRSVMGMPKLFYHLALVQCLVWLGLTAWNNYGQEWFTANVYGGDEKAPDGSAAKIAFSHGVAAFGFGGQLKSGLQLISALVILFILLKTRFPPRFVYAPCIFAGALANFLASFAVGSSGAFAIVCFVVSIMPEAGSFAIPFGLVAALNKKAEEEGKPVSTALQMALLNCCITVGQQICHLSLALFEVGLPLKDSLTAIFVVAGVAHAFGGTGALFLNDKVASRSGRG